MNFVNGALIDPATGRVEMSLAGAPATYNSGFGYTVDGALTAVEAGGPPDTYNQGWGVSAGRLHIQTNEVIGIPPSLNYNGGFQRAPALAEMFVSTTLPIVSYNGGWPIAENGAVCVTTTAVPFNAFDDGFDGGYG